MNASPVPLVHAKTAPMTSSLRRFRQAISDRAVRKITRASFGIADGSPDIHRAGLNWDNSRLYFSDGFSGITQPKEGFPVEPLEAASMTATIRAYSDAGQARVLQQFRQEAIRAEMTNEYRNPIMDGGLSFQQPHGASMGSPL
jgi:hypothetical protein